MIDVTTTPSTKTFPRLMQATRSPGLIVLVDDQQGSSYRGVVLATEDPNVNRIGSWYDRWVVTNFVDYTGSITLRNSI